MNLNSNQSSVLFSEITSSFIDNSYLKIIVFPPFLYAKDLLSIDSNVSVGVQNFHPESNGFLMSCGALRTMDVINQIEDAIGKPVIASNQAMLWDCLRLAGINDKIPKLGKLFTEF